MTRTRLNERLVVFSKGERAIDGVKLEVGIRPSEVDEVMPDLRFDGGKEWTRIVMRNKSEHVVNHSFAVVIHLLNRLPGLDDIKAD